MRSSRMLPVLVAMMLSVGCSDAVAPVRHAHTKERPLVAAIDLGQKTLDLAPGDTLRLAARVRAADGRVLEAADVTWRVDDPSVARVEEGLVIPIRPGLTRIVASSGDRSGSVAVNVWGTTTMTGLTIMPRTLALDSGTTVRAGALLTYSNGVSVWVRAGATWRSLDPSIASIESARLTGVGVGRTSIVATVGAVADTVEVTVARASGTLRQRSSILYGFHTDLTWYVDRSYRQGMIARARAMHARASRNSLLWSLVEPTRGVRDWSVLDTTVDDLVAGGIEPIMAVYGSPSWANGVPASGDSYSYLHVPTDSVAFQRWVAEYKEFVRAAARRYRGTVRLWEIGNEQNYEHFWRPRPNVAQYASWYEELREAIKEENPDAIVAVGGLTLLAVPASKIGPNINGVAFMNQLYARGVFPDAVGVHPYTDGGAGPDVRVDGAQSFHDIEAVRAVMVAWGQSARPMWVTEWGWSTADVTPEVQAAHLRRSLELLETRYGDYVTVATYFALSDFPPHYSHGLYDAAGTMKPAGLVFREFLRP